MGRVAVATRPTVHSDQVFHLPGGDDGVLFDEVCHHFQLVGCKIYVAFVQLFQHGTKGHNAVGAFNHRAVGKLQRGGGIQIGFAVFFHVVVVDTQTHDLAGNKAAGLGEGLGFKITQLHGKAKAFHVGNHHLIAIEHALVAHAAGVGLQTLVGDSQIEPMEAIAALF